MDSQSSATQPQPKCPRCGGRLFSSGDKIQQRPYLSCLLCSREYHLTGEPVAHYLPDSQRIPDPEPVLPVLGRRSLAKVS